VTKMGLEEYKGVYVFAQQVDNELSGIAFELLGKAKELASDLGTDVTAVLIGSDVKGLTDELAEYGADKVIVVDDPEALQSSLCFQLHDHLIQGFLHP
jgi:electron transfer flavoprotein alpha subunit